MTVIAVAMLGTVLLASAVLGLAGVAHELMHSARGRRWVRRRRHASQMRAAAVSELVARSLCLARRVVAEQLKRPAPVRGTAPALHVREQLVPR